jgi:hypothetical protein
MKYINTMALGIAFPEASKASPDQLLTFSRNQSSKR